MRVGIAIEAARVSAVALRRGRIVWAAEAAYDGAEDLERALAALAAERPRGATVAAVGLGSDVARVKTITGLPRVRHELLATHVRLNSRRYFLQNGVPLVTDACSINMGSAPGALLAGAPVPIIDAITRGLGSAGMSCQTIFPLGALGPLSLGSDGFAAARATAIARSSPLTLLPDTVRAERSAALGRSVKRWAWIAIASWVFAATTWFIVQGSRERAATQELARLKPGLEAALSIRADLDGATDALALLARVAGTRSHRARFLASLARALPDSAFLVSVRLEPGGRGSIAGYASNASQVLARLERAGLLRRPLLDGPVTREVVAGRERERFAIRFEAPVTRTDP